jgi:phospholipid/cholesterol/gamma-HCH transport system substrate-binding protein
MMHTLRKSVRPVIAIIGLMLIAGVVSVYILSNQRLRFPFVDEEPFHVNVALATAQAVTPGQGQTAQVAGVQIGDIGKVTLRDGQAIVRLDIKQKFKDLIHTDARALLRPRTGLKDMYVQVIPGSAGAPVAKDGFTIPATNTLTDVNLDEILASFDARARDYIALLANGAGEGLRGRGKDLADVFRRFGPTMRDLATVNRSVAQERVALRRLVSSLSKLNTRLARKPADLSQLVTGANDALGAFASEDDRLRDTVTELAPTLRQASTTLTALRPFAQQLGPAARSLVPAMRALDDANREVQPFAREAAPILRTRIRPFVREARPLVRDLRPAATNLAAAFPELERSARVLNAFVNMLGHNPAGREAPDKGGREEGYLFWLAWLAHETANLINIDDANGPMRPIFLTGTCGTLTSLVNDDPGAEFALGLSPLLAGICSNPQTTSLSTRKALGRLGEAVKR